MSLDYPEYEELRKKSKFLGLLWRIGDVGYYLFLMLTIVSPFAMIYTQFINRKSNLSWSMSLLGGALMMAFWGCLFLFSAQLKGFALKQGKNLKSKA